MALRAMTPINTADIGVLEFLINAEALDGRTVVQMSGPQQGRSFIQIETVNPTQLSSAQEQLHDPDRMIRLQDSRDALQRATGRPWDMDKSGLSITVTSDSPMDSPASYNKLGETLRHLHDVAGLNFHHIESSIRIFDVGCTTGSRIRATLPPERFGNGPAFLPIAYSNRTQPPAQDMPPSASGTVVAFPPRGHGSRGFTA